MNARSSRGQLHLVPAAPTAPAPTLEVAADLPPAAGPLDEVRRMRMAILAEQYLEPTPALRAHLTALDTRGAWYAERVLTSWSPNQPDAFWGLVNHYVRTHLAGPPALLDVPAWVAAGPPPDRALALRWDSVASRVPDAVVDRLVTSRGRPDRTQVAHMDELIAAWPEEHWGRFLQAYALVEAVLHTNDLGIPVLDD